MPKIIAYHGRQVTDPTFDYKYVGLENAVDQEGPGFYFTTKKEEAIGYGSKGIVITAELMVNTAKFFTLKTKPKFNTIRALIRRAPDYKESLMNFAEDPSRAFQLAIETYLDNDSAIDAYLTIQRDFYSYSPKQYLENLVWFGYNGHIIPIKAQEGWFHYIIYNTKCIKTIDVIPTKELKKIEESKLLSNKILLEYAIDLNFDKLTPVMSRYDFVEHSPKFKNISSKLKTINIVEKYRKNSGEGLPLMVVSISRLIPTQNKIDSERLSNVTLNKEEIKDYPFVVKLDNNFYLLDGHHRVYRDKLDGKGLIKVHCLDLDRL